MVFFTRFSSSSVQSISFCLCFDLFRGGFVLILWWSPHHRFSCFYFLICFCSVCFWWCGCFTAAGGGSVGVSTSVVVMVFLGSRVVFCLHTCFCSTRVMFHGFWFPRVFCLFDGLEWIWSWFPATALVLLLVHASWW
jgi:hypothetical protein